MTNSEAIKEIEKNVFRNTDNFEMKISKDCYKLIIESLIENEKLKSENEQLKIDYKDEMSMSNEYTDIMVTQRKEIEQLKAELEKSVKCINDTWLFTEEIVEKSKKRDLSLFRSSGIGGCDMYQGCPPICRIHDELLSKHEEIIYKSIRTVKEETEQHLKGKQLKAMIRADNVKKDFKEFCDSRDKEESELKFN